MTEYLPFTYVLGNGSARSKVATVRVLVAPVADAPLLLIDNGGDTREVFRTGWERVGNPQRTATLLKQQQLEGWRYLMSPEGWGGSKRFRIWSNGDAMAAAQQMTVDTRADPGNGSNWLELGKAARNHPHTLGIERSIDTVAGAHYVLSLDLAGRPGYGADDTRITISVDDQTIGSDASTSPTDALAWHTRKFAFLGSGGQQTIRIVTDASRITDDGRGMMIDDRARSDAADGTSSPGWNSPATVERTPWVRQRVLSVPKRLRYHLEHDRAIEALALRIFLSVVEQVLRRTGVAIVTRCWHPTRRCGRRSGFGVTAVT